MVCKRFCMSKTEAPLAPRVSGFLGKGGIPCVVKMPASILEAVVNNKFHVF